MQGKLYEAEAEANLFRNHSSVALRHLAEIQTIRKNYDQAIELFKEFQALNPNAGHSNQRFGLAYWLDGQKEKGKELLLKALQEYKDQEGNLNYDFCYDVAGIYATLGEKRKALDLLQDSNCHIGVGLEYYATRDPFFIGLWDNPEFQQIIQRRKDRKKVIRDEILSDKGID